MEYLAYPNESAEYRAARIELLARMGSGIGSAALETASRAGTAVRETPLDPAATTSVVDRAARTDVRQADTLVPLYEAPDGWSKVLAQLPGRAQVITLGTDGELVRIRYGDVQGYVPRSAPLAALVGLKKI